METPPPVIATPASVVPPSAATDALLRAQRSGGSWFFWIAGLSLINTVVIHTGGTFNFVIGLGLTAIADTVFSSPDVHLPILAYIFDAFVLGIFALFGVFARKGHLWAFITGMVLYALDAVLYVVLPDTPDWLSIGFHAFALFSIWGGLQAARKLKQAAVVPVV